MADFTVSGIIEVDASRAIRSLTNFQKKLDTTIAKLKETDRVIKQIDGKNIRIDVTLKSDKALADAEKLDEEIKAATTRVKIPVEVDDRDALAKVKATEETIKRTSKPEITPQVKISDAIDKLATLQGELAVIQRRKDIGVNLDTKKALIAATDLREKLDILLSADHNSIEVGLDTRRALVQVEKLNAEVNALLDEHKTIRVNVKESGFNKLENGIGKVQEMLGGAGGAGMIGAIALLISMVGPLGAAAAGMSAGLVGSFATAGVGLGAFAAFAIPTFKKIALGVKLLNTNTKLLSPSALKKYNEQLQMFKKGNPLLYDAAKKVMNLKDAYMKYVKALQPEVLRAFNQALKVGNTLLGYFGPIAEHVAPHITGLFKDMNRGLKTEDWKKFFAYVKNNSGGFITIWGKAVGNFVTGIANMIRAFNPLSKWFNRGLLGMSRDFKKWSEGLSKSKGFQQFVDYVKKETPVVGRTLGDLIKVIIDLAKNLAPLGDKLIKIIDSVSRWYDNLTKTNPKLASMATQAIAIAAGFSALLGPLSAVLGPFKWIVGKAGALAEGLGSVAAGSGAMDSAFVGLLGPIGAIVAVLGGLGAALALTDKNTGSYTGMLDKLKGAWNTLKDIGKSFWNTLQGIWKLMEKWGVAKNFQQIFSEIADIFTQLAPILKPVAQILGVVLVGALLLATNGVKNFLKPIQLIADIVGPVIKKVVHLFQWMFDKLVGHSIIPDLVNGIIKEFKKLAIKLLEVIPKLIGDIVVWWAKLPIKLLGLTGKLVSGVVGKFKDLWSKATNIWGNIKDAVGKKFDSIVAGAVNMGQHVLGSVGNFFGNAKDKLGNIVGNMKDIASNKFQDIINGAKNILGRMSGTAKNALSGAGGWLVSAGEALMHGLASGISKGVHWVTDKISSVGGWIKGHLPGSPVKYGPLRSWNDGSPGRKLMQLIAKGINTDTSIKQAVNGVTRDLARTQLPKLNTTAAVTGAFNMVGGNSSLEGSLPGGRVIASNGNSYHIKLVAPVGSSSADIGRELIKHIDAFERAGGRRKAN